MSRRLGLLLLLSALFILTPTLSRAAPQPPDSAVPAAVDNPLWRNGGSVEAVAVQGDYAYLAQGTYLRVVDLSTLETRATLPFRYPVRDVAVSGDYAYVVTNLYGDLHVVDVQDPAAPEVVGSGELLGWSGGDSVVVRGDYAYVLDASGGDGLVTFDISNPTAPAFVTQSAGSYGRWLRAGTNHLYALRYDRLYLFDLTQPGNPQAAGDFGCTSAENLAVAEPYVYVTDYTSDESGTGLGMAVVDVSDPDQPQQADSWVYYGEHTGSTLGVAVADGYAYVGYSDNGGQYSAIYVLDVSDPSAVAYLDKSQSLGGFYNFLIQGDVLYIAGGRDGDLTLLSLENPASPSQAGTWRQPGRTDIVRLSGDRAYVVAYGDHQGTIGSIWIYDVQDPLAPAVVARQDSYPAQFVDAQFSAPYLYLCGPWSGLTLLDGKDLGLIGRFHPDDATAYCNSVAVEGTLAYVIDDATGTLTDTLDVIDVSQPARPNRVHSLSTQGEQVTQAVVDGRRLYLTDWDRQVVVFDLNTPQAPTLLARYPLTGLRSLAPHGDYVYASVDQGSTRYLQILDVSDLQDIQPLGTFPTLNTITALDVVDQVVYLGGHYQVHAVDVSDPLAPQETWSYSGPAEGLALQAQPPFILAADEDMGLTLYATHDGAARPATGRAATVFPDTPLVIDFAQDMSTSSVRFTCTPDPGGWTTKWTTPGGQDASGDDGRTLLLYHAPFAPDQAYTFQVTQGTTADSRTITPFGLDFNVARAHLTYLPLLLRGP